MNDEIITELWRIKDELAREANYNVHALCEELRKKQSDSETKVVNRSDRFIAADDVCRDDRDAR
ncbi:MAG: hypothetical protein JW959_11920 [Pirellulales bacterium]|nr:hypothetical protein [Pirellulales bacterium]